MATPRKAQDQHWKTLLFSGKPKSNHTEIGLPTTVSCSQTKSNTVSTNFRFHTDGSLQINTRNITIVQCYVPINLWEREEKEAYYKQLTTTINYTRREATIGDLNA